MMTHPPPYPTMGRDKSGPYGCLYERNILMLRLPPFRYLAPGTIEQAAYMLAQEGEQAMLVAGGTDLYPNMKRRQFTPPVLIGLRGIAALKQMDGSAQQGMRVGAGVTLTTLAEHPIIQEHYAALATAAGSVPTPYTPHLPKL